LLHVLLDRLDEEGLILFGLEAGGVFLGLLLLGVVVGGDALAGVVEHHPDDLLADVLGRADALRPGLLCGLWRLCPRLLFLGRRFLVVLVPAALLLALGGLLLVLLVFVLVFVLDVFAFLDIFLFVALAAGLGGLEVGAQVFAVENASCHECPSLGVDAR